MMELAPAYYASIKSHLFFFRIVHQGQNNMALCFIITSWLHEYRT